MNISGTNLRFLHFPDFDENFSKKLIERQKSGKGFTRYNIVYIHLLYKKYRKSQTLSNQSSFLMFKTLLFYFNPNLSNILNASLSNFENANHFLPKSFNDAPK